MGRGYQDWKHSTTLKNYEQLLREGNAYSGVATVVITDNTYGYVQVYNPSDSNVYIIVKELMWRGNIDNQVKIGSVGEMGSTKTAVGLNRYVGGPYSSGEMRVDSNNFFMPRVFYHDQGTAYVFNRFQDLYVAVPPGEDFTVLHGAQNITMTVIMLWFEVTDY